MGNTYAEVNLTTQHMYYVKDGQIALETDVVTGNPNKGNDIRQEYIHWHTKPRIRLLGERKSRRNI